MRLSIVIPTRERKDLLRHCLTGALACDVPDLQIVVSDNDSGDGTVAMLQEITDPRLTVVQSGRRLSMRQNFETALNAATGDYVLFSGDDDGISPQGIKLLHNLLERDRPDAVGWEMLSYAWPSRQPGQGNGFLSLKYKNVFGQVQRRDPQKTLKELERGTLRNYRESANIYHGCVSRGLIDRVRAANDGTYFAGAIPDVYTCIANLYHMQADWLWLGHPITFGGVSDRSNGAAHMSAQRVSADGEGEKQRFLQEAESDPGRAGLSVDMPSVHALTLDMLRLADSHHGARLNIHYGPWFRRILARMADQPRVKWDPAIAHLTEYADRIGHGGSFAEALAQNPHAGGAEASEGARPRTSRVRAMRVMLSDPANLATVADATRHLEALVGPGFDVDTRLSWLRRPFSWIALVGRARRLAKAWAS